MKKQRQNRFWKKEASVLATVTLLSLLGGAQSKYAAENAGQVTTANKTFIVNKKVNMANIQSSNNLFSTTIAIPSPGTSTVDGDKYTATYTFTKKADPNYRLLKVIPYIEAPNFTITNWGGPVVAKGNYIYDESIQAWRIPDPMVAVDGSEVPATTAVNGTQGIKLYLAGEKTGMEALSYLTNDGSKVGTRPVILLGDVRTMPANVPQATSFTIFQERTYEGAEGMWHAFSYRPSAYVEYEFDATVTGTNPDDQLNLTIGDNAHFDSVITLQSPQKVTADIVWQESTNDGATFTDIEGTSSNSNGQQSMTKSLDVTATKDNDGNLYRVKITPNETDEAPVYTEPARLTLKKTSASIEAAKVLEGADLDANQFEFILRDANGVELARAKNTAAGSIPFTPLWYTAPGEYTYTIEEVDDGQKNITYDSTVLEAHVLVKATDEALTSEVSFIEGRKTFTNTFTPAQTSNTDSSQTTEPSSENSSESSESNSSSAKSSDSEVISETSSEAAGNPSPKATTKSSHSLKETTPNSSNKAKENKKLPKAGAEKNGFAFLGLLFLAISVLLFMKKQHKQYR